MFSSPTFYISLPRGDPSEMPPLWHEHTVISSGVMEEHRADCTVGCDAKVRVQMWPRTSHFRWCKWEAPGFPSDGKTTWQKGSSSKLIARRVGQVNESQQQKSQQMMVVLLTTLKPDISFGKTQKHFPSFTINKNHVINISTGSQKHDKV